MEKKYGNEQTVQNAKKRLPKKILRKRKLENDQEVDDIIYVFPDDKTNTKILENALKWKKQQK